MATQIVELTGDEVKLLQSLDKVIQKQVEYESRLKATEREGQKAGKSVEAGMQKSESATNKALRSMVRELRSLGPAGKAAADAVSRQMQSAGRAGNRAASMTKRGFVDASAVSSQSVNQLIDRFRETGKVGKDVAATLAGELKKSGEAGTKSIGQMIAELEEIDPAAAEAASKAVAELKPIETEGGGVFERFSTNAIAKIGLIGTAIGGIRTLLSATTDALDRQRELSEQSRESLLDLAGAQQDALKNLANFSNPDKLDILERIIPEVQTETQFPSQKDLTIAASNLASSGVTDKEDLRGFLTEAAKVTRLTPDQVDEFAKGSFLISRATGLDPRESLGFLLSSGANSQIVDPADVASTLPNALNSGFLTSTDLDLEKLRPTLQIGERLLAEIVGEDRAGDIAGNVTDFIGSFAEQNRRRIASETGAFFGLGTELGLDESGDSTRTNVGKLLSFIEDLADAPGTPLSRLQLIQGNKELRETFVEKLPVEQAFKPAFRSLVDPQSKAFQLLLSKVDAIGTGTDAVDAFDEVLERPPRAVALGLSDASERARSENAKFGGQALLAQVRKIVASTLDDNSGFSDRLIANVLAVGGLTVEKGRLEGTTATEEAISGIRELDTLRTNRPQVAGNVTEAIRNLAGIAQVSAREITDPEEAQRVIDRINFRGEFAQSAEVTSLLGEILTELKTQNSQPRPTPQPLTPTLSAQQP